jgi:hypothetical protein
MDPLSPTRHHPRKKPRAERIKDALFPVAVFLPILVAVILFFLWLAPDGRAP